MAIAFGGGLAVLGFQSSWAVVVTGVYFVFTHILHLTHGLFQGVLSHPSKSSICTCAEALLGHGCGVLEVSGPQWRIAVCRCYDSGLFETW